MNSAQAIDTDTISRWWGHPPESGVPGGGGRIGAAVWSGSPREIWAMPDPGTSIIATPLAGYDCEVFIDGRQVSDRRWLPGQPQIMVAGVAPRAALKSNWRMLHIYLPQALVLGAAEELGWGGNVELIDPLGTADPSLTDIMGRAGRELMTDLPTSRLLFDSFGAELAVHLTRRWSNLAGNLPAKPKHGGLAPWQLRRACEAMEAHLEDDIGLDMLAGIAGCSPAHFSRAFKQSTGMPPFRWLLLRRIERAKALLCDPDIPLAEAALSVGFSAQPQFTTAFRRSTGMTPGAWRKQHLL